MTTLAGSVFWMAQDPHAPTEVIGTYGSYQIEAVGRNTDIACPYCRDLLIEYVTPHAWRVVRLLDETGDGYLRVIGQTVPPTHRMLLCQPCGAQFTAPKAETERARWLASE